MYLALKNRKTLFPLLGFLFLFLFLVPKGGYAQEDDDKKKEQDRFLNFEEPDFLIEKDTIEVVKKRKKKRKKKTFNGLKTKRAFTRSGKGSKMTLELFYYLKKHRDPDPFVTPLYLFEIQQLRIVKINTYDKEKYPPKQYRIVHGPYKKTMDTITLVEGYFYVGTKHHRWETYDHNEVLKDKQVYYKGWPAESKITYYDAAKTRLKEVIPIEYGEKSGMYVSYYPNGSVKERGKYEQDIKVGKWYEYYEERHRSKRITQHASNGFDEDYKPQVLKEWDEEGKITIGEEDSKKRGKGKLGKGRR